MNRRNFIKNSIAASLVTTSIAKCEPLDKPLPSKFYQVHCYIWDFGTNSRKEYDDLWTYPEPWFGNLDSAIKFIEDHITSFDLSLVNVIEQ